MLLFLDDCILIDDLLLFQYSEGLPLFGFQKLVSSKFLISLGSLVASGIFPHITKQLIENCCPKSRITYCKVYPTITDIRDGIENDSTLDISYPVYGKFISLVTCFYTWNTAYYKQRVYKQH